MFDADQRLIVCNERYLQMYGFSSEVVKPGIRLREIMEYSVSLGNYRREDAERAIAERPTTADKREQAVLYQRLNDGRVIAVMHQPMAGGGSVATYEDVTQTVRAEEALRDYARKLERSNRELQEFASIASHDLQEPLRKIEAFGGRLQSRMRATARRGRPALRRAHGGRGRPHALADQRPADLFARDHRGATVRRGRSRPDRRARWSRTCRSRSSRRAAGSRSGELPEIEADPTQMRQLLQNLNEQRAQVPSPGRAAGGPHQRAAAPRRAAASPRRPCRACARSRSPTTASASSRSTPSGSSASSSACTAAATTPAPASASPPAARSSSATAARSAASGEPGQGRHLRLHPAGRAAGAGRTGAVRQHPDHDPDRRRRCRGPRDDRGGVRRGAARQRDPASSRTASSSPSTCAARAHSAISPATRSRA